MRFTTIGICNLHQTDEPLGQLKGSLCRLAGFSHLIHQNTNTPDHFLATNMKRCACSTCIQSKFDIANLFFSFFFGVKITNLLSVGLGGDLLPNKSAKSTDIGTWLLWLVVSPICRTPPIFITWWFPSNPSRLSITLLDFLGGDNTTGPSCELKSKGLDFSDSPFRGGLGSNAGFVGAGTDEKYLNGNKDWIRVS